MKSVVLLTVALFLISAPAPDSNDIAEMTANFIVPEQEPGLQASQQAENREVLARHTAALADERQSTTKPASELPASDSKRNDEQTNFEPPFET